MTSMQFSPAVRTQLKVKIGLMGTAGTGKTWNALAIAEAMTQLMGGGKIALIDSERGRGIAYAGDFEFDHLVLPDTSPETYIGALALAHSTGYDVIVVDSISHEWNGKDGILQAVDRFGGWKEATPRHDSFIDSLFSTPRHVICTMRAKTQYQVEEVPRPDGKGTRQQITKLGIGPVQRDNVEYEFDLLGLIELDHSLRLHKSILSSLPSGTLIDSGEDSRSLGRVIGSAVHEWVNEGIEVEAPAEAGEKPIEALRMLLGMEGYDDAKIDEVFNRRRLELGALTERYVSEQTEQSIRRLRSKGLDPDKALSELTGLTDPEPEPAPVGVAT
jgi:AAA domain